MKKLLAAVCAVGLLGAASAAPAQSIGIQVGPQHRYEQDRHPRQDDNRYRYEQNRRQYERQYWRQQREYRYNRCNPRFEQRAYDPYRGRYVCVNREQYRSFLSFNIRF